MKTSPFALCAIPLLLIGCATPDHHASHGPVADSVIAQQQATLAKNTEGRGFGPQSPRDLHSPAGTNSRIFGTAPAATSMNLCNIHFHKNAEHKGGEFTRSAGNGDGLGNQTGFVYTGRLSADELRPVGRPICPSAHGGLASGDTIEIHYVYSSAQVKPAPTLGACLSESIVNPQLRVETQVAVLVNDKAAQDFGKLAGHGLRGGYHQALNIPSDTGTPIQYAGSTTGPAYNEKGSPLQVSWSVRPKVVKVDITTVGEWCQGNDFKEDHAHGVRNLVSQPDLLSRIQ